jgi:hypothetical protein
MKDHHVDHESQKFWMNLTYSRAKRKNTLKRIHNNMSWVFQPVTITTIVFFYYNHNYKFMLMTM